MVYRFAGFELDSMNRELRSGGESRPLQPQAFAVLEYLVRHRDRVVSKQELLGDLWPDAVVGEGSLRRAIHAARAALGDEGCIRTVPRLGYRFVAEVDEVDEARPRAPDTFLPRFVRSGDVHIAHHTMGEGDVDVVLVAGWAFPMRSYLDHPELRSTIEGLTELGRVVMFDKRGTGLSDRVKDLPPLEQRVDDLRAVLEAVGSEQTVLIGFSEGGPLSLLFATMYPELVRGLVLVGSFARWAAAPDYEPGWTPDVVARLREYIGSGWGAGETIRAVAESRSADPEIAAWAARAEQQGASPGAALELLEMNLQIDVRPLLRSVSVPTVVLHHTGDPVISVANSRYLAAHIPGARLVEVDGVDHAFFFENHQRLREALQWVLGQDRGEPEERFLSTVLVALGDGVEEAGPLDDVARRHRGVSTGGELTWSFDGPQRAIRCGHALVALGKVARVGIHTGEVGRRGGVLVGDAVDTASAVAAAAQEGEVWVSRVVRDLVHGSPLCFEERPALEPADGRPLAVLASLPDDR